MKNSVRNNLKELRKKREKEQKEVETDIQYILDKFKESNEVFDEQINRLIRVIQNKTNELELSFISLVIKTMVKKKHSNLINDAEFNRKLENDIKSMLDNEYKTKDERFNALMDLINDYVDSFCR